MYNNVNRNFAYRGPDARLNARDAKRKATLAANPGLEAALLTDHYIIKDIAARFEEWGTLSEKQVALVLKIANEKKNPGLPGVLEEAHVPAPIGRVTFTGKVVSTKYNDWGVLKMTVKVEEEKGTWLAWLSVPSNMGTPEKGEKVTITATLKQSDKSNHFAFGTRPTGRYVTEINTPVETGDFQEVV